MISDWFLDQAQGFISWFFSLFGSWQLPDWFTGLSTQVGSVLSGAAGMGVWIPWALIFGVVTATFLLWGIGLLIKFARWLLGLVPTMGGG